MGSTTVPISINPQKGTLLTLKGELRWLEFCTRIMELCGAHPIKLGLNSLFQIRRAIVFEKEEASFSGQRSCGVRCGPTLILSGMSTGLQDPTSQSIGIVTESKPTPLSMCVPAGIHQPLQNAFVVLSDFAGLHPFYLTSDDANVVELPKILPSRSPIFQQMGKQVYCVGMVINGKCFYIDRSLFVLRLVPLFYVDSELTKLSSVSRHGTVRIRCSMFCIFVTQTSVRSGQTSKHDGAKKNACNANCQVQLLKTLCCLRTSG